MNSNIFLTFVVRALVRPLGYALLIYPNKFHHTGKRASESERERERERERGRGRGRGRGREILKGSMLLKGGGARIKGLILDIPGIQRYSMKELTKVSQQITKDLC